MAALDERAKQDMESSLQHAVRVVQTRFSELERDVLVPSVDSSRRFATEHPILTTFIAVFSTLSFFPIVSFIVFVVLISISLASIASAVAFFFSVVFIVAAVGALLITLCALFVASIFLTATVVSLFLVTRLGQHVRSKGGVKHGVTDWARETRDTLTWHEGGSRQKMKEEVNGSVSAEAQPGGSYIIT